MSEFHPPLLLRGAHVQSALASLSLRRRFVERGAGPVLQGSSVELIECSDGVRLLAEHTPPAGGRGGRLAVLIHGWEGSARSLYMVSAAARLAREGFRVVRLNLRDHGDTQHLNPGLFHSCRLGEVVEAVAALHARHAGDRLYLGGFSLGGNFALRVASRAAGASIAVEKVVAVCPVLDPCRTMAALDSGLPHYRLYFLGKWRRSLERKRQSFPDLYDFGELRRFRSLQSMTDFFVRNYTEFPDLETYLRGYAVTGDRLAELAVPTEILLADDDPVIPVEDVRALASTPALVVRRSRFGGHCGFIADYGLRSWLDEYLVEAFGRPAARPQSL